MDHQVKAHAKLVQLAPSLVSLDQANVNGVKQDHMKPTEPLVLTVQQVPLLCLDLRVKAHAKLVQQDLSLVFPVQVNANGVKQDLTKPTEPLVWIVQQVLLLCLDLQTKAHVELVQQDLYLVSLVQASASGVRPDLMKSTEPHVLIVL